MRGSAADAYGDLSDVGTPIHTGIPAAIEETTSVVFDQATQRPQIIRTITCVVPNWADIVTTDTLFDATTGNFYLIESMTGAPQPRLLPARQDSVAADEVRDLDCQRLRGLVMRIENIDDGAIRAAIGEGFGKVARERLGPAIPEAARRYCPVDTGCAAGRASPTATTRRPRPCT